MKNKFTARLCLLMCLIIAFSCFTACKVKPENINDSTTLGGGDSWQSDSGYDKVIISQAELVDLVGDALGEEMPEDFKGNLNTLTPDQLEKVEEHAKNEGLHIEKDQNGDTVIKKDDIPMTEASKDEVKDIFNKISAKDPSNLSKEELEELSKVAKDEGLVVSTKPNGDVVIVKPVPTTKILTKVQTETTTKKSNKTTKNPTPKTTSVYKPNHATAASMGTPIQSTITTLDDGWIANHTLGSHTAFFDNEVTKDGGCVAVGITTGTGGNKGIVAKFTEKGKLKWDDTLSGNGIVSFDGVTVLNDGSIIVVGSTLAKDLVNPDEYKCEDTVEGVIIKYSENGNREWIKILGGSGSDIIYAVAATPDGGFVVGGKTTSSDGDFSNLDSNPTTAFVYKLNANGNIDWKGGMGGKIHCAVKGLAVNDSGEVFAAMENNCNDGDFASLDGVNIGKRIAVIAKYSANGNRVWANSLYETGLTNMNAITYSDDGGCVVAGQYSSSAKDGNKYSFSDFYNGGKGGTYDGVIAKYRSDGSVHWITPVIGFDSDIVSDITRTGNGYAISGYTASNNRDFQGLGRGDYDAFVYTLSKGGTLQKLYSLSGSAADNARTICSNGSILYLGGSTYSTDGSFTDISPAATADDAVAFIRYYEIG